MPCWDPELIPGYSQPPAQGLALTKWTRKLAWHLGGEGVSGVSLLLKGTLRAFSLGAQLGVGGHSCIPGLCLHWGSADATLLLVFQVVPSRSGVETSPESWGGAC